VKSDEATTNGGKPEAEEKPQEEAKAQDDKPTRSPIDKAPQSWKPAAKAVWKDLPPAAREEVVRRERQVTQVLGESAQARQLVNQFTDMIQPYRARIESTGLPPLQAVNELLKADHLLTTSPPAKRAQFMASLIKEYGVDIRELDNALAGQPAADPTADRLEQMVAQRLQPFQQFVQQQARQAELQRQAEAAQTNQTIQSMAADTAKFPHFYDVKDDMADLIEMQARRGQYMTLEQAYSRAVSMNPELTAQSARRQAAEAANSRAQRALNASVSVGGAPNGGPSGRAPGADLRGTIEAAFERANAR
jgi:DNA-binding ferritin-like protein